LPTNSSPPPPPHTTTHVSFKYVLPGVGVFFVLLFLLFVVVSLS
jgi:hypothetical protein